ncbi:MAG TPA: hypothetical protein VFN31_03420 [Candidatus Saccharimonadales bacterium]|nr:hypothetical protein [Candidatus Saccharimonadales bacterium]
MAHESSIKLPLSLVSQGDLRRVKRELDDVSDTLMQMEIREGGEKQPKLPKISRQLDDLLEDNNINLLVKEEREALAHALNSLVNKAPVLHMSFSAEPSTKFLDKLLAYIRESIHPYALVTVGLAPSIGAGCMVRTTNKYFDLSLKQTLVGHRAELIKQLDTSGIVEPVETAS